jgi:hypothetical protein
VKNSISFSGPSGTKLVRSYLKNKPDVVVHTCNPRGRKTEFGAQLRQKDKALSGKKRKS